MRFLGLGAVMLLVITALPCKSQQGGFKRTPKQAELYRIEKPMAEGKATSVASIARLKQLAHDADFFIRARAITTLSYTKDSAGKKATAEVAEGAVFDREWSVRHAAINALRRVSAPNAKQAAQTLLNDPSEKVRKAAQRILDAEP